ncbi:hypothetical protein DL93DRAFT_769843 [Clavulina sp. PMI_390]|nr:hypothetical protein DL93DRAFT_769843 [Clavulina sp. PMI_390]
MVREVEVCGILILWQPAPVPLTLSLPTAMPGRKLSNLIRRIINSKRGAHSTRSRNDVVQTEAQSLQENANLASECLLPPAPPASSAPIHSPSSLLLSLPDEVLIEILSYSLTPGDLVHATYFVS